MRPAAVLFDCDGVIVDSEPLTDRIIAANLTRHGLPMAPDEVKTLFRGGTMASVAETARTRGAGIGENWIDDIYAEIFQGLATGTPLIAGIEAAFDALDAAGVAYAVGSNGPHRKMAVTLGQHPHLHRRLAGRIFSREDVARPKPAPDLYLHAASCIGAEPARCVVIEDSATGARAARSAGMACLGYAPLGDGASLAEAGARPFRDMAELPALLGL
ncbi:HAD family hydrolase [Albidovulum sediminicola]|uniref:HAD family phosphatase n=1 Tax=Albidovulum sediminicola TaxID=2984331 RepID=A0ABT2YZ26_9RHOB|nr:HAD family phosphatase [Defluviimonas sp. WL0075]MCV2864117.1 HAD family phosphatase [Defluviimonas sp. WL0075]